MPRRCAQSKQAEARRTFSGELLALGAGDLSHGCHVAPGLRLARSEKRHARHTHTRLRPAAVQRRPQPAACRAMRLNVRAHLLPMRILFTVCGALASMLRTQLRILLHVFVLVTSCAGWLAGLGCSTRVDITRAASRFEWAGARK